MKSKDIRDLSPLTRRKLLAALAASPFAAAYGSSGMAKLADMLIGSETAYAAATQVKYFIEINLRDQWDFMHFMVPPGLATAKTLYRAETGAVGAGEDKMCGLYQDPTTLVKGPNNLFFTSDSKDILPHASQIAALETIKLCVGRIHGHEAANGMRSPGRGFAKREGQTAMWLADDGSQKDPGGDEFLYSSSPTPAMVHLNMIRQTNMNARAVALKFLGRSDKKHSVYHHAAGLSDNGFVRIQSREQLLQAFSPAKSAAPMSPAEISLVSRLLKRLDADYLKQVNYTASAQKSHGDHQDSFLARMAKGNAALDLSLTEEERDYWGKDVPPATGLDRMHLWEQSAMASKLLASGAVNTVAMEFSFNDIHGPRPKKIVTNQGKIIGMVLARLIADLKAKNLWDDTLIFINSTDGGRSPKVDSYGNTGKNTMILAGGGIKGGYYGDIRVASTNAGKKTHEYSYHIPDAVTGQTIAAGTTGNEGRVGNSVAYRTILEAMGAGSASYKNLPDVAVGEYFKFMLKNG